MKRIGACVALRGLSADGVPVEGQEAIRVAPRFRPGFAPDTVVVGFTLIEILVVVVIVGVLALAVTISIATAGGERQLARESERLQGLIDFACHQAELSGREIGLRLDRQGYAFSRLGFDGWSSDALENELRPRDWVPGLGLELLRDGRLLRLAESDSEPPQIVCFSSGELSPFLLRLQLGDVANRYELRGEADGRIVLDRVAIRP
jgi:general secretion pathway protein H